MKKITIDPVTRVEGHGKVTIHMDDNNQISESRLHIVEFRGFERFVQGRPYWEAPVLVQRLCGICPVSHHLAAAKAIDKLMGVNPENLTAVGEKMRRLMHYGQLLQSHALHFFYLAAPDFLMGIDSNPAIRNVVGVIATNPELAKKGVLMRKFGQEIIAATAGKKIHGTGAIPGGINKNLSIDERDHFLQGDLNVDTIIEWSQQALNFFKDFHTKNVDMVDNFVQFPSNYLSIIRSDGALDMYDGGLRAKDSEGNIIFDHVDNQEYFKYLAEGVKTWSYMKFPYIRSIGPEKGWYRVGPLARLNNADFIPTPLAQDEFLAFKEYTNGKPNDICLHTHWARLIETLHAAEVVKDILHDKDLQNTDLVAKTKFSGEGVGIIEAPRGTLFHHYKADTNNKLTMANLIVSTTNNNEPMNRAVNEVAKKILAGKEVITEGMKNAIEVAIRAYDPCLSCATHALGKMPLEIELYNSENELIDTFRS